MEDCKSLWKKDRLRFKFLALRQFRCTIHTWGVLSSWIGCWESMPWEGRQKMDNSCNSSFLWVCFCRRLAWIHAGCYGMCFDVAGKCIYYFDGNNSFVIHDGLDGKEEDEEKGDEEHSDGSWRRKCPRTPKLLLPLAARLDQALHLP